MLGAIIWTHQLDINAEFATIISIGAFIAHTDTFHTGAVAIAIIWARQDHTAIIPTVPLRTKADPVLALTATSAIVLANGGVLTRNAVEPSFTKANPVVANAMTATIFGTT